MACNDVVHYVILIWINGHLNGEPDANINPQGSGNKEVKKYRIIDQESTDFNKSRNGGNYTFGRDFFLLENGKYEVSYWTSADFDFCDICGCFGYNDNCQEYDVINALPDDAEEVEMISLNL